ncbi:Galactosyltransferase [Cordylochernes scorpioides]|uniref:Hexosyltransferase n=1 Tax=Cordylochernes scorpioides TaxID=51811 RepID=A0ABY6L4N5_9ARAC|nr:Galactosyltransferase [Cordylochernes scorpioides]
MDHDMRANCPKRVHGWASEEEVVYGLVFILAVGASWVFFRYRCKVCLNVAMAGQDCCGGGMRWRVLYGAVSWVFLLRVFLPYFFGSDGSSESTSPAVLGVETNTTAELQTLVNLTDFQFTLMTPHCQPAAPLLLFLVHSAPDHGAHRAVIRRTWGSQARVVFLLGQVNNPERQLALEAESLRHNDLVQGNFLDSYRNLTYKQIMGLKWASFFCPKASYIFKVDDDVFIDVPQLSAFLRDTYGPGRPPKSLLLCYVFRYPFAKRSYRSKWRVTFQEYKGHYYPSYCSGYIVGMSSEVANHLHKASLTEPFFWIDDVFVSGILASKVGLSHTDLNNLVPAKLSLTENYLNHPLPIRPPPMLGAPDLDLETIKKLWVRAQEYYNP